ncbi:MAG: exodeoxyribonuclease VII large subunit [Candidatus Aminicenantes bacterium]|nr:exodeoxyribonuclease VII large subunit [Candidatus Aminicenantes bacterium]
MPEENGSGARVPNEEKGVQGLVREGSLVLRNHIYSVTEITQVIKAALETAVPQVWVAGEVSNVRRSGSGHIYLTLKDAGASMSAALWKNSAERLKFELKDGLQIVCRGRIDVYPPRGSYQLIIDQVEPKGKGALQLAFEQLKEKLRAEGLFDPERKKKLPLLPKTIGVVTSPTGAALIDILRTIDRRFAKVRIVIYPARVQGDGAAAEIVEGIDFLGSRPGIDVIIVGRGGGSIEDLWAFNEEPVARAIFACPVPVISAVGHEVDFTIADFVADIRASTPTAAAEMVVEKEEAFSERIENFRRRAEQALRYELQTRRGGVDKLARHGVFEGFQRRLWTLGQRVDELESRAWDVVNEERRRIADGISRATLAAERMAAVLGRRLGDAAGRAALVEERIIGAFRTFLGKRTGEWERLSASLQAQSPLSVLKKGYAVVWLEGSPRIPVTGVENVRPGDAVVVSFYCGEISAEVRSVDPARSIEESIGAVGGADAPERKDRNSDEGKRRS